MKKILLITIVSTFLIYCSFQSDSNKNIAVVNQQQGLFIFCYCKPNSNYDYVGSVKTTLVFSDPTPSNRIKFALKKVKKDFPTANGIIFTDDDFSKADAIILK